MCLSFGIGRTEINALGKTVIKERKLKTTLVIVRLEVKNFEIELAFLMGTPWELDLDPFKIVTIGNRLKWNYKIG